MLNPVQLDGPVAAAAHSRRSPVAFQGDPALNVRAGAAADRCSGNPGKTGKEIGHRPGQDLQVKGVQDEEPVKVGVKLLKPRLAPICPVPDS